MIPGVEINLEHDRVTMDMLGYFLAGAPTDELQQELAELRVYRVERNDRMLERLAEIGLPLDPEDLAAAAENGAVGRPHIGEAMVRRGYVELDQRGVRALPPPRRPRVGRPAAARTGPRPQAAARVGRPPVLAHPGIIRTDAAGLDHIVRDAARAGLAGIECYYPLHDAETVARCLGLARKYALVPTGGSDYHGSVKPKARLGVGSLGGPVPDEVLADLRCVAEDQLQRCLSRATDRYGGGYPKGQSQAFSVLSPIPPRGIVAERGGIPGQDEAGRLINRLRRVEGQARGLQRMIEQGRPAKRSSPSSPPPKRLSIASASC